MKKILIGGSLSLFALALSFSVAFAAKLATCATIQGGTLKDVNGNLISTGYDKYGYNYQAHMFNGWYDNYSRPSTVATDGDRLMMKWNDVWLSNKSCDGDFILDRPNPVKGSGAWLTNHATGTYDSTENFHWNGNVNTDTKSINVPWNGGVLQYSVTFSQSGTALTGTLTDSYYPTTGSISGSINGNSVTFAFAYPDGSIQGTRNYIGTIDSSTGNVSGTWSETGSEQGTGTWSISGFGVMIPDTCSWSDFVKIVAVPTDAKMNNEDKWMTVNDVEIGPAIWGDFAIIQEISDDPCGNPELGLLNYKSQLRSGLGNW